MTGPAGQAASPRARRGAWLAIAVLLPPALWAAARAVQSAASPDRPPPAALVEEAAEHPG